MSCQSTWLAANRCAWSFCVLVSMSAYRDDFLTIVEVDDGVGAVKGLCGMKCVLEGGSVCGESAATATVLADDLVGRLSHRSTMSSAR